jgi:hypothetical protein
VFLTGIADFTFTRTGDQFGTDSGGNLVKSTTDNAAFIDGEGILLEGARTNLFLNSFVPATQTITVTAVAHTITVKGTGDITVTGVGSGVATEGSPLTLTPTAGGLICTVNGTLTNVNVEVGSFGSSFIETFGATATRSATSLTRAWPFPANGISGQIKVRPQFDAGDTYTINQVLFQADSGSTNDSIRIRYSSGTGDIRFFKIIGGTSEEVSTTIAFVSGDLLNVRFKLSAEGITIWVNAEAKVTSAGVIAKQDFTTIPDTIRPGNSPTSELGFQTVETLRIWNEAKSDNFMENLT